MSPVCLVNQWWFDLHSCPWYRDCYHCYASRSKHIARVLASWKIPVHCRWLVWVGQVIQYKAVWRNWIFGPFAPNQWTVRTRISTLSPGKPPVRPKVRVTASMEMFGSCEIKFHLYFWCFQICSDGQCMSSQEFFAMFRDASASCSQEMYNRDIVFRRFPSIQWQRNFSFSRYEPEVIRALPHHDQAQLAMLCHVGMLQPQLPRELQTDKEDLQARIVRQDNFSGHVLPCPTCPCFCWQWKPQSCRPLQNIADMETGAWEFRTRMNKRSCTW